MWPLLSVLLVSTYRDSKRTSHLASKSAGGSSADHWGCGYATEGARAAIAFGFEVVGLREVVSFTVPANNRSHRVMEKIGMKRNPAEDFDHPSLPTGHKLHRHVLYRIGRPAIVF